jgi:uncharacterized membrane protein YphA (DoxX/SURF4 family)
MKKHQDWATLLLRIAMGATFLSAVATRFGLWGKEHGNWQSFIAYAAEVNSFAPTWAVPPLAIVATALEILLGVLLIVGFKTKMVALGAGGLTVCFALAMAYSSGLNSPLDYSVFVDAAAMFLLATLPPCHWSLDRPITKES